MARSISRSRGLIAAVFVVAGLVTAATPAAAHNEGEAPAKTFGPAVTTDCGAGTKRVLILSSTVSGACSSIEAQKSIAQGFGVDLVDDADWLALTKAKISGYRAVILGDATCGGSKDAAETNAALWASAVTGNVVIMGSDPTFHQGQGGAQFIEKAIAFATAKPAETGAYITLSCYYHGVAPETPVPMLAGFGTFTVTGVGCYNNAHIVATHPALDGLTDATLSNWSCSVHEAFDKWPLSFEVLAIAKDIGSAFTAPDGSVGTPYIVARGVEVISDIKLTPDGTKTPLSAKHLVTATIAAGDTASPAAALGGKTVTFSIIDGPNKGKVVKSKTNAAGVATMLYGSAKLGTDTIEATFVDGSGLTQRSNRVTNQWIPAVAPTSTVAPTTTTTVEVLGETQTSGSVLAATGPREQGYVTLAGALLVLGGLAVAAGPVVVHRRARRR